LLNEDIKKRYKKLNGVESSIVPVFLDQKEQIHPDIFSRLEVELDLKSSIDKTKAQKNAILIYQKLKDNKNIRHEKNAPVWWDPIDNIICPNIEFIERTNAFKVQGH